MLLDSIAAYLPNIETVNVSELVKTTLNSLSERKLSVEKALGEVTLSPGDSDVRL
jgi:hypothetical protein